MPEALPEFIGTATMRNDGTVVLNLRAQSDSGDVGIGQLIYPPGHPQYQEVIRHVGGLRMGESKGVKPFPQPKQIPRG